VRKIKPIRRPFAWTRKREKRQEKKINVNRGRTRLNRAETAVTRRFSAKGGGALRETEWVPKKGKQGSLGGSGSTGGWGACRKGNKKVGENKRKN